MKAAEDKFDRATKAKSTKKVGGGTTMDKHNQANPWVIVLVVIAIVAFAIYGTTFVLDYQDRNEQFTKQNEQIEDLQDQLDELADATPAPAAYKGTAADTEDEDVPTNAQVDDWFNLSSEVGPVNHSNADAGEPAMWNLQQPEKIKLLKDWVFTVTLDQSYGKLDKGTVAVFYGDGKTTLRVSGATMRYLPCYTGELAWVKNHDKFLESEDDYSMSQTPSYHTVAGNF